MAEATKKEFEFKDKLESWVEGIFDLISAFLRTVFTFNCRPFRTWDIVQSDSYQEMNLSQPGIFMIFSYVLMLLMVKDIDFSDPVFSYNMAVLLNALGALSETAKVIGKMTSTKSSLIICPPCAMRRQASAT